MWLLAIDKTSNPANLRPSTASGLAQKIMPVALLGQFSTRGDSRLPKVISALAVMSAVFKKG